MPLATTELPADMEVNIGICQDLPQVGASIPLTDRVIKQTKVGFISSAAPAAVTTTPLAHGETFIVSR